MLHPADEQDGILISAPQRVVVEAQSGLAQTGRDSRYPHSSFMAPLDEGWS